MKFLHGSAPFEGDTIDSIQEVISSIDEKVEKSQERSEEAEINGFNSCSL